MAVTVVNRYGVRAACRCGLAVLAVSMLPIVATASPPAAAAPSVEWIALDTRLEQWLGKALLAEPAPAQLRSLNALADLCRAGKPAKGPQCAAQARRHLPLIERDIHHRDVPLFVGALLAWNQRATAERIFLQLTKQGDKAAIAQAAVSLAEYDLARQRWQDVVRAAEVGAAAGTQDETSKLRFMHGVALQELRKHRAALAQYAKVALTSPQYRQAQLNMAVANIRQDWWTDGHAIIAELLKGARPGVDAVFNDRLNTVLGFSLMRQQYYRSARDAFRNVGLDGPYTNRALLGILLSAMYQQDYVGALNAAKALSRSKVRDLPADEAPLLTGYIYERLQQPATAMGAYGEAVDYYEKRVAALTAARLDAGAVRAALHHEAPIVSVADTPLELGEVLPPAVFANMRLLDEYRSHVKNRALETEYAALDAAHTQLLLAALNQAVAQRVSYLNHYMSQARFGLAAVHEQGGAVQ